MSEEKAESMIVIKASSKAMAKIADSEKPAEAPKPDHQVKPPRVWGDPWRDDPATPYEDTSQHGIPRGYGRDSNVR